MSKRTFPVHIGLEDGTIIEQEISEEEGATIGQVVAKAKRLAKEKNPDVFFKDDGIYISTIKETQVGFLRDIDETLQNRDGTVSFIAAERDENGKLTTSIEYTITRKTKH